MYDLSSYLSREILIYILRIFRNVNLSIIKYYHFLAYFIILQFPLRKDFRF